MPIATDGTPLMADRHRGFIFCLSENLLSENIAQSAEMSP